LLPNWLGKVTGNMKTGFALIITALSLLLAAHPAFATTKRLNQIVTVYR
jgi:hypothetical protein